MIRAFALAMTMLSPDCQRLCLGVCRWDWAVMRCEDSRVKYLGTWDPLPLDYTPPRENDFPAWVIPYPRDWGEYPLEKQMTESIW